MKNYKTIYIISYNNQCHVIKTKDGDYLVCYGRVLAFLRDDKYYLDKEWLLVNIHASRSRNKFLGKTTRQTLSAINREEIEILDLN